MSQQINLYDPALLRQREWLTGINVAGLAAVLLLAVGLLAGLERMRLGRLVEEETAVSPQVETLKAQVAAAIAEVSRRKPDPRIEAEIVSARSLLAFRNEVLAVLQMGLGSDVVGYGEFLRGFARQTPAGLWLTGFSVSDNGGTLEIRGRTTDPALLPEYIRRLNGEKAFQGRAFGALQMAAGGQAIPAPGTAAPAAGRPRYHEFILVPVRGAEPPQGTPAAAVDPAPRPTDRSAGIDIPVAGERALLAAAGRPDTGVP